MRHNRLTGSAHHLKHLSEPTLGAPQALGSEARVEVCSKWAVVCLQTAESANTWHYLQGSFGKKGILTGAEAEILKNVRVASVFQHAMQSVHIDGKPTLTQTLNGFPTMPDWDPRSALSGAIAVLVCIRVVSCWPNIYQLLDSELPCVLVSRRQPFKGHTG